MHKRTRMVAITPEVRQAVEERDGHCCIFCGRPGRGEAHFVNRSQGGLGFLKTLSLYVGLVMLLWITDKPLSYTDKKLKSI